MWINSVITGLPSGTLDCYSDVITDKLVFLVSIMRIIKTCYNSECIKQSCY